MPSTQPLGDILGNKEALGRIAKWAAELSQYGIKYVPRTTIKSQTLADFMADWTPSEQASNEPKAQTWTTFIDGAWGQLGARAAAVIVSPSGIKAKFAVRLSFKATNNIAEYEGLIVGLSKAKALGAATLVVKMDSQVVAGQVEKEYVARELELIRYLAVVRSLGRRFHGFTLKYIPRAENEEADELAKAAANKVPLPLGTFFQELMLPTTAALKAFKEVQLTESEDWRQAIVECIKGTYKSETEAEAVRMAARARGYTLIDGSLSKKGWYNHC